MTPEKYIEQVLTTENLDFEGIRGRLSDPNLRKELANRMSNCQEAAMRLDELKKIIFYGKDLKTNITEFGLIPAVDFEPRNIRLLHHSIGIMTEAGELNEQVWSYLFFNGELDVTNIEEELGDGFWYAGALIDTLKMFGRKVSFGSIFVKNIKKLVNKRFKKGFTEYAANNRDLNAERKVLEGEAE